MKKLINVLLIVGLAITLAGCGGNKVEEEQPQQEIKVAGSHIEVLDATTTYEEMTPSERTAALEVTEDYWGELTEEQQNKYAERKDFILNTKDEAIAKWEAEKKVAKENETNKSELQSNVEALLSEYEVLSCDIITLTAGGYSVSVQIILDVDKESATSLAVDLGNKIGEIISEYDVKVISSKYQIISFVDNNGIVE